MKQGVYPQLLITLDGSGFFGKKNQEQGTYTQQLDFSEVLLCIEIGQSDIFSLSVGFLKRYPQVWTKVIHRKCGKLA
jgi:hypothetical protein